MENPPLLAQRVISDTIVIALATSVAYLVAFLYEVGFVRYYDLPIWLIKIDLDRFVIAISWIGGYFAFIQMFILNAPASIKSIMPLVWHLIIPSLNIFLGYVFVRTAYAIDHWMMWAIAVLFIVSSIFTVWIFIAEPIKDYKDHPFLERYRLSLDYERRNRYETIYDRVIDKAATLGFSRDMLFIAVLSVITIGWISLLAGGLEARKDGRFLAANVGDNEMFVSIRGYKDYIVMANYDAARNTIGPRFRLVPVGQDLEWQLIEIRDFQVVRQVNPAKVSPPATKTPDTRPQNAT